MSERTVGYLYGYQLLVLLLDMGYTSEDCRLGWIGWAGFWSARL